MDDSEMIENDSKFEARWRLEDGKN